MKKASSSDIFKNGFWALGILATVGLLGYGLTYIIVMPKISPDGFVPKTIGLSSSTVSSFSAALAAFVLLYAFAFLPVTVIFTVKKYSTNPFALVLAGSLIGISLVIEIINNLPIIAAWVYPGSFVSIPSDTLLYLRQVETLKFLAYDVAGFTLAYMAFFCYAIVYFRTYRLLSYTIIGSIVAFIANVPFLWFAPNMAIILMAISIFAFASVPIFLVRMSVE
jgi:hypothetical protein